MIKIHPQITNNEGKIDEILKKTEEKGPRVERLSKGLSLIQGH